MSYAIETCAECKRKMMASDGRMSEHYVKGAALTCDGSGEPSLEAEDQTTRVADSDFPEKEDEIVPTAETRPAREQKPKTFCLDCGAETKRGSKKCGDCYFKNKKSGGKPKKQKRARQQPKAAKPQREPRSTADKPAAAAIPTDVRDALEAAAVELSYVSFWNQTSPRCGEVMQKIGQALGQK